MASNSASLEDINNLAREVLSEHSVAKDLKERIPFLRWLDEARETKTGMWRPARPAVSEVEGHQFQVPVLFPPPTLAVHFVGRTGCELARVMGLQLSGRLAICRVSSGTRS